MREKAGLDSFLENGSDEMLSVSLDKFDGLNRFCQLKVRFVWSPDSTSFESAM